MSEDEDFVSHYTDEEGEVSSSKAPKANNATSNSKSKRMVEMENGLSHLHLNSGKSNENGTNPISSDSQFSKKSFANDVKENNTSTQFSWNNQASGSRGTGSRRVFRPPPSQFRNTYPRLIRGKGSKAQYSGAKSGYPFRSNAPFFPRTNDNSRPRAIICPPRNPDLPKTTPTEETDETQSNIYSYANEDIQMIYVSENKESKEIEMYSDPNGTELYFKHFEADKVTEEENKAVKTFPCLDSLLVENLEKKGLVKLRPIQRAMMTSIFTYPQIDPASSHADILATSATGSGKSGAYLTPIIQKAIERSKIWTPEKKKPIALIFANSNLLIRDIFKTMEALAAGTELQIAYITKNSPFIDSTVFDIGICTVGRFKNHYGDFTEARRVRLDLRALEYIIIDEADKMGKDASFLALLKSMRNEPKKPRIFAFSATMDQDMKLLTRETDVFYIKCGDHLAIPETITEYFWDVNSRRITQVYGSLNNGIASFHPTDTGPFHPFDTLFEGVRLHLSDKKIMVFCKRIFIAEKMALRFRLAKIPAASLHKDTVNPDDILEDFKRGDIKILFVTLLMTRGYDADVDVVINFDLPVDPNDYIHRCGRTGRNGKKGIVITFIDLCNPDDYNRQVVDNIVKRLVKKPLEDVQEFLRPMVQQLHDQMLREENATEYENQQLDEESA